MLQRLNISTRIIILITALATMLVLVMGLELFQLNSMRKEISNIANRDVPVIKTITELTKFKLEQSIQFQRLIRFGKFMLVNIDAKNRFFEANTQFEDQSIFITKNINVAKSFSQNVLSNKASARDHPHFDRALGHLKAIESLDFKYLDLAEKTVALILKRDFSDAEISAQKTENIQDEINIHLKRLLTETIQHAIISSNTAKSKEQRGRIVLYVVSAVFFGLTLFLGYLVRDSLIRPLKDSLETANLISSGQRSIRFPDDANDEVGQLGLTINRMLDTIEEKESELLQANAELEERVAARTLQLKEKNNLLDLNNRELDRLNKIKNEFLGMAAHDMRTPLAVINGYADLFLCGAIGDMTEEQGKIIAKIKNNGQSMLDMINDLLDISAIESGQLNLNIEKESQPIKYLEDCIDLNRLQAQTKSIDVNLDAKQPLPEVYIDKERIKQVLNNLISNAIKFSHADTTINIFAEPSNDNSEINITVKDEGQGIPTSEIQNLFKTYGKTSVRSTAGEKSTGLGLAIVKKIVEAHGSRVWVESEVGKGSSFHFSLPTSKKSA